MKRIFDITVSLILVVLLLPLMLLLSLIIVSDSRGGVFFFQKRVGKGNTDFNIIKFRTMFSGSDKKGLLTVGMNDSRITRSGYLLRKYKLDEIPQLFNVLFGEMSLVGPRPEVRKYVDLYTPEQRKVLSVKPGITDYASIKYRNENEILKKAANPEQLYINEIMPEKIAINLDYINNAGFFTDIRILGLTLVAVFR